MEHIITCGSKLFLYYWNDEKSEKYQWFLIKEAKESYSMAQTNYDLSHSYKQYCHTWLMFVRLQLTLTLGFVKNICLMISGK